MIQELCRTIGNKRIAPGHYVLELESPRIASGARPGQFVQILCADSNDPLLPRPFSFLDTGRKSVEILYHVVGRGTAILERVKPGDCLKVLGPLGNGFTPPEKNVRPVLVGGGVGIPPLYHWAKEAVAKKKLKASEITVLLGARGKALLLLEKEFKKLRVDLRVSTDDGSKGRKGFVTALLDEALERREGAVRVYTCGPTPMMRAAAALAGKYGVPCDVSVEVPMACGFGACLGCALPVKEGAGRRFAIACCEGPVFQGDRILWD